MSVKHSVSLLCAIFPTAQADVMLLQAVDEKRKAEDIRSVLYPNDATEYGKELRLKQQFFFVSASIQVSLNSSSFCYAVLCPDVLLHAAKTSSNDAQVLFCKLSDAHDAACQARKSSFAWFCHIAASCRM